MGNRLTDHKIAFFYFLLAGVFFLASGCNSTKYVKDGQYMLRKNTVNLKPGDPMANKGEIRDLLEKSIIQKPNTNSFSILPFRIPLKLWRYNRRHRRFRYSPDTLLPKSLERPVILDTALTRRSMEIMKANLFNQGYFYAKIKDTYTVNRKKAYVTYTVQPGKNYRINRILYFVDDSAIAAVVRADTAETVLQQGKEFTYSLTESERSRLVAGIRNSGYYKFTLDNINFILDTLDKTLFRDAGSPFKSAINFISSAKTKKRSTLDIEVHIQLADDTLAFTRYKLNSVTVYPDYNSAADLKDSTLIEKTIDSMTYRYHRDYVHAKVLHQHIYIAPGDTYSQEELDRTQAKLSELGIFQYIRILPHENRRKPGILDYDILLARAKKYDFSTLYELSSGSTYALGHSIGISFRDKNFLKGANVLSIGVNGGLELAYNNNLGDNFISHFDPLTRYYGVNASLDFPKFLAPLAASLFDNSNLPHTIIGVGENVIERINYFTLINTSANFSYNWRQSLTKAWTLSPAFINVIDLPVRTDSFKKVLAVNDYLRNSYKENFIEGENISFTFDDMAKKRSRNYSYLKLGLEEAGLVLGALNSIGGALNSIYELQYAQYTKFDFDLRHYFTLPHSVFAVRFYGGVGVPYGQSSALPYIKQYFSGGPYSLRGWRIRTLGPGSYFDSTAKNSSNQIDRTGDIKLELNGEYRFPITMLFAGAIKMNGALFADAGNIWLAHEDTSYAGGEFKIGRLGQDIAADVGFGTRFDIASFLTLRVDVAMPVKKPYISNNGGWVNNFDFSNSTWRSNNIILNVSIGYPF